MKQFKYDMNHFGVYATELINNYYGKYCGVFDEISVMVNHRLRKDEFTLVVPNIPDYASCIYGKLFSISYHLAGFSLLQRNSFVRAEGEAVERYSHLMAEIKLRSRIIYTSANELKENGVKVCPLKYVNVYTEDQLRNINLPNFIDRHIRDDDKIEWICCKSIYDESPVYVPAQMFFLISSNRKEKRYYMSVSTGTASYKNEDKAMINALTEYLQVDSMMMSWYVLGQLNKISIPKDIKAMLNKQVADIHRYTIMFFDMSLDKPLNVIACIIKNKTKQYPYCAFGMQGDFIMKKAMYRSFMEAYANIGSRIESREEQEKINFYEIYDKILNNKVYDLNDNTKFYLSTNGVSWVDEWLKKIIICSENRMKKDDVESEAELLQKLKGFLAPISKYACYLDITSNEFKNESWHVIRTLIPELLPLSMPSLPYANHPRVIENGGIRNMCIHPCP